MQWPTRLPEFVRVAAAAEIRDVVAKYFISFVLSSMYIWYDTTYNDGERPGVDSWEYKGFPSVWMLWQSWQSNAQRGVMDIVYERCCLQERVAATRDRTIAACNSTLFLQTLSYLSKSTLDTTASPLLIY